MAGQSRDQLTIEGFEPDKLRRPPILDTPLSPQETRRIGRLYVENERLVWKCRAAMRAKYPMLEAEAIASCVDMAFIKAARILDEDTGKLSTIFYVNAHGECRHYIRDHNYGVSAPAKVRELGGKVRKLMGYGLTSEQAAIELRVTVEAVRDALVATAGMMHEQNSWEGHEDYRQTPWEQLEAN